MIIHRAIQLGMGKWIPLLQRRHEHILFGVFMAFFTTIIQVVEREYDEKETCTCIGSDDELGIDGLW